MQHDILSFQWIFNFSPESVRRNVTDLVQKMSTSLLEIPLTAWNLQLQHRQDFLNDSLATYLKNETQRGTTEMKDEVFSSVGTQEMNTCGYHKSDMEDIVLHWESSWLD